MSNGIVLNEMDNLLVRINGIKKISMIHIYDITCYVHNDTRAFLLPGMMIYYDGGKCLNLYAKDKYFDIFVKKVQSVYNVEKDMYKIDKSINPFDSKSISMDEKTKKILDSGDLLVENRFDENKSYSYSLFFEKDELTTMMPIIKYHLKALFDKTNMKINYTDNDISGYKNYYTIKASVDGLDDTFIIRVNKGENNTYEVAIRSYHHSFPSVKESISINADKISVRTEIPDSDVIFDRTYEFINNPTVKEDLYKNDNLVSYSSDSLEKIDNEYDNLAKIANDFHGDWYRLPWGALYGIYEHIEDIDEETKIVSRDSKYMCVDKDSFIVHDDYNKKYFKTRKANVVTNSMELDSLKQVIKGKKILDGVYLIETKINDDKYYYQVASSDSIPNISRDNMIEVTQDKDVIYSGDVYDPLVIKKLVKGD